MLLRGIKRLVNIIKKHLHEKRRCHRLRGEIIITVDSGAKYHLSQVDNRGTREISKIIDGQRTDPSLARSVDARIGQPFLAELLDAWGEWKPFQTTSIRKIEPNLDAD